MAKRKKPARRPPKRGPRSFVKQAATTLTPRQHDFVLHYLECGSATEAATRAGYSAATARVQGPRLLHNAAVAAEIAKHRQRVEQKIDRVVEKQGLSVQRVLEETARLAFSDVRSILTVSEEGVRLKPSEQWSDDAAAAVASISETPGQYGDRLAAKLHDKLGALKLLGQHFRLWADKVELSGPDGSSIPVADMSADQRQQRLAELLAKRESGLPAPTAEPPAE